MAVSHVRAAAARLGAIGFGGSASTSFDASGCDLLVICLSWADVSAGQPPPAMTYAGVPAQQLRNPRGYDPGNGYAAIYLVRTPASGTNSLVVTGTQFLGSTDIAVVGVAGDGGAVGAVNAKVMAGVQADAISLAGVAADSRSVGFVAHRYAAAPSAIAVDGWTQRAAHTDSGGGVTSSIWAFDGTATGTVTFAPDASPTYVSAHIIAVEVRDASHVAPDSNIAVVAAKVDCLGGSAPGDVLISSFDPEGADWLVIALAAGNSGIAPLVTYEGQPLRLQPLVLVTATVGSIWWAAVPAPGSGSKTVTVTGQTGWFGATSVLWAAVAGTSGALVTTATGAVAGVGLSFAVGNTAPSRLLAFAVAEYTDIDDIAVNAEWTRHAHSADTAEPRAAGWVFSASGGTGQTFEAVCSDYTNLQVLVIGLRADLTESAGIAGSAAIGLPAIAESGAGTSIALPVPTGQKLGVYWESFFDIPTKADPQPSDFHLAHIPAHIDQVYLSFGEPQCSYSGLSDNVLATTRLRFDYPASLLKAILDGVTSRHPHVRFYVAIQQFAEGPYFNEPYSAAGFGGMTGTHVANWKRFCDDVGLAGIVLDYEVLSQLAGFGVTLSGPLVSGNTISIRFQGHYEPYPGGYAPNGPDPVDYDFTVSRSFSGSSDATLISLAAGLKAAMEAAGVPQGTAYPDTPSGIGLLRLAYNFTVTGVIVTASVTGGASQASAFDADNSFDYHCQYDGSKRRYCWTDAEMKAVIDLFRAGLPRPTYEIWLDVFSTGFYGEVPFDRVNPPLGYNHGYDLWLTRPANAATAAKLDGIHLMSYDVGDGYDPREALQAALHYLPAMPVKIGLRVGPPDYAGVKQTVAEMVDYANHAIVQGAAGAMVYALLWDLFDQQGDFTPDHPDINLCTWAVARRFGHADVRQRAVSRLLPAHDPTVRS